MNGKRYSKTGAITVCSEQKKRHKGNGAREDSYGKKNLYKQTYLDSEGLWRRINDVTGLRHITPMDARSLLNIKCPQGERVYFIRYLFSEI